MEEIQGITERVLSAFAPILSLRAEELENIGILVAIPTFDAHSVAALADRAKETFKAQDTMIDIETPTYIIGDLHGNIFDLIRILVLSGPPPANRFLFLGDYVDRGQYSVEIIVLLFALMVKYPQNMFLLRGNHEFERVNTVYGLKAEVEKIYGTQSGEELYKKLNECFNYMPLAALVGKDIFGVHGGISPQISSFRQLKRLKRPIVEYDGNVASDLTWSDPSLDTKEFLRSTRGNGVAFGVNAVKTFRKQFGIRHIIRAHQCVDLGIERFAGDALYTVFSCSNYQDAGANKCGLIYVTSEGTLQAFSLPPITQVLREAALLLGGAPDSNQVEGEGEADGEGMSLSSISNAPGRGSILSLAQSPSMLAFAKKRNNRSQLSIVGPRSSGASHLPKLKPSEAPALNVNTIRRPGTAEPGQTMAFGEDE